MVASDEDDGRPRNLGFVMGSCQRAQNSRGFDRVSHRCMDIGREQAIEHFSSFEIDQNIYRDMTQLVTRKHNIRRENLNQDVEGVEIAMVKGSAGRSGLRK